MQPKIEFVNIFAILEKVEDFCRWVKIIFLNIFLFHLMHVFSEEISHTI